MGYERGQQQRHWLREGHAHHVTVGCSSGRGAHAAGGDNGSAFGAVLAPATFYGPAVHHLTLQLHDSHGSVLMGVEFDEGESAVGLHADLGKVADRLEQGDEVGLGAVGNEVADINGGVVGRGLSNDRLIGERTTLEVHGSGRASTTNGTTGCTGGGGTLSFLVGPVDSDGA